jgi:hypothetical protein
MSLIAQHFAPLDPDQLNDFTTDLALLDSDNSHDRTFAPSVPPFLSEDFVRQWDDASVY